VKEQSHKNEMRDALRGDFERLRARLEDVSVPSAPVAVAPPAAKPIDTPVAVPLVEQVVDPDVEDAPPARSSWLDRLRDRR
jgi:hypothetical protein